jgi:hypothetical protein
LVPLLVPLLLPLLLPLLVPLSEGKEHRLRNRHRTPWHW